MMFKQELQKELEALCVKCIGLKASTAKVYAQKLFNKYSQEDGCISWNSDKEWKQKCIEKQNLKKALDVLKTGFIKADTSFLKLEDISYIKFKEEIIEITTKNGKIINYDLKSFEYLKDVFK